jgi:beta-galactosidase
MLGVCYYPEHWPATWWADDARRMRALGISYVRIGEFAWSRIEPEAGRFEWDGLDRAIAVLARAGLRVVLGTPTATPPKWLIDRHPDILPYDFYGRPRNFGSRRHYSFSSPVWWEESRRIVTALAARYGEHEAIAGWQTDNEYGCHDTVLSYGPHDLAAFRDWIRRRYQTPEALNDAWGNTFWSMELRSFDEIALPAPAPAELAPGMLLDFQRFASDQVAAYNRMQVEIIRAHSPGRFVTHNFMNSFTGFDHWAVSADLDFAAWDSYPLGHLRDAFVPAEELLRWSETSHPDVAPVGHVVCRGLGRGNFWVMEQQPGPVNWAAWNPVPKPGMIRLFTWEALAHGAEVVSYFRWRQAPFGQEQMHAGLNRPDRNLSEGGREAERVAAELKRIGKLPRSEPAEVALVYDYEAAWIVRIQPQGEDFSFNALVHQWYGAARRLGLDIDVVAPGADLKGYRLVLVPCLPHVSDAALAAFENAGGYVLYGPRTGSKTRDFRIPENLPPGPLAKLVPLRVAEVGSLPPCLVAGVSGRVAGKVERWREHIESMADIVARFHDGKPAVVMTGKHVYIAGWPDAELRTALMQWAAKAAGLATLDLPEAVRIRRRGDLTFAFNYGDVAWTPPVSRGFLLGGPNVDPQDVAAWE